ncbi:TetR/AcrR family transcriptional regulator [Micromonospora sp. NBC_01655]|uniref:TetR/AcrR family transcriptional regulator n=1 Tax=Micromonospora sp. NBC_01655 TaxID=2975983 RepID=UPI002251B7B8|nr:TetR/AcrR family transcriptional regulator [Micromonospora sp. NBC_01655]MCX4472493.1 TetR/AcrR family transcriptional regulator [Micromonospora sp. NBC_01655]
MGRKAGRSPGETRRLLLDAAGAIIRTRGVSATLDDIAQQAGVSKGGLVYHFASKEDLIRALADDLLQTFRNAVESALDPADTAPGRLTRAYVRACLDTSQDERVLLETIALLAQLITIPAVAELARADAECWDRELRADGLPEEVLALVVSAADGAVNAPLWGTLTRTANLRRLEDQLIRLTLSDCAPPSSGG